MDIKIVRSPARVSWWVTLNDIILDVCDTKVLASESRKRLLEKVGL